LTVVTVDGRSLRLTNLDKEYWPQAYLKGDLIRYFAEIGHFALPYLAGRPIVMNRYPDGVMGKHFYQKNRPEYTPAWIPTVRVAHSEKTVEYIVCENRATLVWLANQGCIEIHAWLARADRLDRPDLAVLDLDPAEGATFRQVITVALLAKTVMAEFGVAGWPKTSGATGVHIFIPLEPVHTFGQVTKAMEVAARLVTGVCEFATTERSVEKRAGKVYIDYLQNTAGKTMAFPYSVRPLPGAPVSTPVSWPELATLKGPSGFTMRTVPARLKRRGDAYAGLFEKRYRLDPLLALAGDG